MARDLGELVCIIDDDDSLRRSLRNLLTSVGFAVEAFESAEAFLEAGRREHACLVLDLRMPGMNGFDLLDLLNSLGSTSPVIVLTGHGDDDARRRALSAGAIAFLEKPFQSSALLDAVEQAMAILARPTPNGRSDAHDHSQAAHAYAPTTAPQPIRIADGTLGNHCHICAFFNGLDEQHRVLRSFIKDGFDRGEKIVHIVDPELRDDHLARLARAGIDVNRTLGTGQLDVRTWDEVYLRGDRFEQDRMLALAEEVLQSSADAGYPLTRILANMEWALLDKPGVEELVEYESRVNSVLSRYRAPVICAYDLTRFSASVVMDILRTHPTVIVGGVLQENPFFVAPDQFLLEIRERGGARRGASIAS
jgi:FixJ family two-component response regulator